MKKKLKEKRTITLLDPEFTMEINGDTEFTDNEGGEVKYKDGIKLFYIVDVSVPFDNWGWFEDLLE